MRKELITYRLPKSPISEVFRTLRTNIQFMNTKKGLKTLMVTSTTPAEGKSWVTSNLAVTFAQAGKKVVLIDCDLRKGRQHAIFGVTPTPGFSNYLSGVDSAGKDGSEDILAYVKETEIENLYLIPAGNVPPNPSELLISEQMVNGIETLKEYFDLVIIDTTPSCLVTDAVIISRYVDTSIIVASYKSTKIEDLQRIKREIENVGGKIAGVVLNKVPMAQKKYSNAYYYGSTEGNNTLKRKATSSRRSTSTRISATTTTKNSTSESSKTIKKASNSSNIQDSEELLKQLNKYISEEKSKLKGE